MNMFMNIHGVGAKIAENWYSLGYRTLEEIKENVSLFLQKNNWSNLFVTKKSHILAHCVVSAHNTSSTYRPVVLMRAVLLIYRSLV